MYIAQLHRRAVILDKIFQHKVILALKMNVDKPPDASKDVGMPLDEASEVSSVHGPYADVKVYAGPIKRQSRMRKKIAKYMHPYPRSQWPLTAHIGDPVRVMIVCSGPAAIIQVSLCPPLSPLMPPCAPPPSLSLCFLRSA